MKICAIISVLVLAAAAESYLKCSYSLKGHTYQCVLTIYNPDGWNNFTAIGGLHLHNFTNADVTELHAVRNTGSITPNIPFIICDTFPHLVSVELSEVGLTEIGDEDFASCLRIERLQLESNNIRSIAANAFTGLGGLDILKLSFNNLTSLPENVFANQQSLRILELYMNPFDHISYDILQSLERLESFSVTNIGEVQSEWFNNTRLETLGVTHSRVTALPDCFIGLGKLLNLFFTNNEVSQLRSRAFAGLTDLRVLYLNDNKLTELRADTFFDLNKLTDLFIDNNPIESIDEYAFRGLDRLQKLNLKGCKISQIQSNHFQHLHRLISIVLWDNKIEELPKGVFSASKFQTISLSKNRLKVLHRNSFGSFQMLEWLDMADNEIYAFDRTIIDDAVHIRQFFFKNNSCASFDTTSIIFDRRQILPELEKCFDNYKGINDTTTTEGNEDTTTEGNEDSTTVGNEDKPTKGNEDTTTERTYQIAVYSVDFGISFTYYVFLLYFLLFCVLLLGSLTVYLLLKRSTKDGYLEYLVK